jgi:hypothetical protein
MRCLLPKGSDDAHNVERATMPKRSIQVLLFMGLLAFAIQPTKGAQATPMIVGGFYQFEDHSSENHSGQTLDGIDLSFGSFASSNIKNSSFVGAVFEETDFSGANLQGVDMTNANLTNATFTSSANMKNDLHRRILRRNERSTLRSVCRRHDRRA